jgi:ribosomal protein S18 acetylase RimI-like enzyme
VGQLSSVAIRRANENDLPAITRVESAAKSAILASWGSGSEGRYSGEDTFTYLSEDENVFGFVTSGSPKVEFFRDNLTGEIVNLYVHPEYQGHGVGKKLLVHGLSVLKRRGFEFAIIWIPEIASRAIAISTALNFEEVDGARLVDNKAGDFSQVCYKLDLTAYF